MNKKTIITIRAGGVILLAGVIFWLVIQAIVPSGRASYQSNFCSNNYFISQLTPVTRIENKCLLAPPRIKIIGDPVYFNLHPLRTFRQAKLSLEYKIIESTSTKKTLPIIEAGILADKKVWRYDLQPLHNKIINDLSQQWTTLTANNGVIFLEKEKVFATLADFLANLPPRSQIALYHYNLKSDFVLPNYSPSQRQQTIDCYLRGPYELYTYLKDEPFDWQFVFKDLNQNKDNDPIDVYLYYSNTLIDSRHLDDDGITVDNNFVSGPRQLSFVLAGLPAGLYKIEVKTNDDIITEKITTKQSKASFLNKIWLAPANRKNLEIFTDSRQLQVKTINPASRQIINFGGKKANINQTYKQFRLNLDQATSSSWTKIILAKDGLVLSGDGVFAFNASALVNPAFKKVDINFSPPLAGVNYILAHYQPPRIEKGGWYTAEAIFDLSRAYQEKGSYNFLLSVPGLLAEQASGAGVEIKNIRIDLVGISLREKLLKQAIKKLNIIKKQPN